MSQPPLGAGRCGDHPRHVGAEVGLGDRHRSHRLGRGQLGQPLLLLVLGASVDQGTGQDLRPGDQGAARPERAPRELLGGHHHAQVVGLAPGREPAVLLRDGHAEATHLGHARDDLLGDVGVGPVDVLGPGSDLLLGETVEGLPNQLEVGVEVAIARSFGQRGQEGGIPEGGHEGLGRGHPVGGRAPLGGPPDGAAGQVGHGVGGEGASQPGLGVAVGAVAEEGLSGANPGGGVGDVVGQDLRDVGTAGVDQGGDAGVDDRLGQGQRAGGGLQVRGGDGVGGHPPRLPARVRAAPTGPTARNRGPDPNRDRRFTGRLRRAGSRRSSHSGSRWCCCSPVGRPDVGRCRWPPDRSGSSCRWSWPPGCWGR